MTARKAGRRIDGATGGSPWRAPTRRAFVAMIGAAAAALATPHSARLLSVAVPPEDDPPRCTAPTRWIGHC